VFEKTGFLLRNKLDWWDEITLSTRPGSDQKLKFVAPRGPESGAPIHSYLFLWDWATYNAGVIFFFFILRRVFIDAWTTLWTSWVVEQALPDTTGEDHASVYFAGEAHTPFSCIYLKSTRHMTTSGPWPIFEGLTPIPFPLLGAGGHSFRHD
jgi:hypothetical protein